WSRRDLVRHELFAAPGADDNVGLGADHIGRGYDAVLGILAPGQRGEDVDAAGHLDELGDPTDAADHRLVPFFEIDARMTLERAGARAHLRQPLPELRPQLLGLGWRPDPRPERAAP